MRMRAGRPRSRGVLSIHIGQIVIVGSEAQSVGVAPQSTIGAGVCKMRQRGPRREWPQKAQKLFCDFCAFCGEPAVLTTSLLILRKAEHQVCRRYDLLRCEFCNKLGDQQFIHPSLRGPSSFFVALRGYLFCLWLNPSRPGPGSSECRTFPAPGTNGRRAGFPCPAQWPRANRRRRSPAR